jgi:uncharacterized protein (DUF1697 family)
MPERIIEDAVERFDVAIQQQQQLVDEVKALRTSNRRQRTIIGGLAVLIVFGGVGLWTAFRASSDAKDAAHAVAALQNEQETERVARLAESCRRSVDVREDNRAMWLYLLDEFADAPIAADARRELDERLPSLQCVDSTPVPATTTPED